MKRYSRFGESGSARWLFPARDVAELLTGNRRRSHQTAFGDGEHQHSLLEAAARGRGIVFSAARADVRHGRIADKFITHVHPAFDMGATDNEARLTYGWKNRIRVTHGKV